MNPVAKSRTYKMILVALFAALIAVGAFIRIPVPFVPFTMQTFFIVLSGMLLGRKLGAASAALYVLIGIFGAVVTGLLTAFPKELVIAIAGLALLNTIGNGLAVALRDEGHREAALITFLVTLSGVVIAGIGSAFWGVVAGSIALGSWR